MTDSPKKSELFADASRLSRDIEELEKYRLEIKKYYKSKEARVSGALIQNSGTYQCKVEFTKAIAIRAIDDTIKRQTQKLAEIKNQL